jgi:hypothetical protein
MRARGKNEKQKCVFAKIVKSGEKSKYKGWEN